MLLKNIFIIFFFLGFLSCIDLYGQEKKQSLFDLGAFIDNQINFLKDKNLKVSKSVIYNGKEETNKVTITDWVKELTLFKNCNINKPSLIDSYNISKFGNNIIYQAKNKSLKAQKIVLVRTNTNNLESINISYQEDNLLFSLKRELALKIVNQQLKSYSVSSEEKVVFLSPEVTSVSSKIL